MTSADRIILPVAAWPKADRNLWLRCREGRGHLGPDNPATLWSARRCEIVEDAWGRFLSWGLRAGAFDQELAPVRRLEVEIITAFIAATQTGEAGKLAPVSLGMVVGALCRMGTAFAPQKDWTWLRRIYARLKFRAVPSKAKHLRVVAAADLYRLGIELMEAASRHKSPFRQATQYRIGLQIALWIARPLRIRNFQDLALGTTLVKRGDLYWLVFGERQTKTGRPIEVPVPVQLMPYIDRYLYEYRPFLGARHGKKPLTTALWLGRDGTKQKEASIRENLEGRTREKFGRPINPHLLRDCAATSFALEDPENVRCTMLVLGHTLMSTTERHYIQARSVEASRTYGGTFTAMRKRFANYVTREPPDVPK